MSTRKSTPSWSDVKPKLLLYERAELVALVQSLYAASLDNQNFLHTRLGLGDDVLRPYKSIIARWLWPNIEKNQDVSVAKAKKALSDFKKAAGSDLGLAELMVFFCEQAGGFSCEYGYGEEPYLDAVELMYENALKLLLTLPDAQRMDFLERLGALRHLCQRKIGYGLGDHMESLLSHYGFEE